MSITVIGQLVVERHPQQEGDERSYVDVLYHTSMCDALEYPESDQDLLESIYDETHVPDQPGIYGLMYVANIHWSTDYYGDVDATGEIIWHKVWELTSKEVEALDFYI